MDWTAEPSSDSAFCKHARVRRDGSGVGTLAGLTFAVKDVIALQGVRACYGNPTWLQSHPPAERDAPVVTRLLDTGATLRGMTVTDELALSLTGENHHYGTPLNPACPARVPGGSSSGSASAVSSGLVDFALGTDTGGSVRIPASHCGVYGMRPSHGRVPSTGVLPLAPRFDCVGWFTRSAATLLAVGEVLLANSIEVRAEVESLSIPSDLLSMLDGPARSAFLTAAVQLAQRLGVETRPLRLEERRFSPRVPSVDTWLTAYLTLQNADIWDNHAGWLRTYEPVFGSLIGRRFAQLCPPDPAAVSDAQRVVTALRSELDSWFAQRALLLLPSAPGNAPLRGLSDDVIDEFTGRGLTLSALASLLGLPQVSLPVAQVDDCPLGVSLVAPRGADLSLLRAVSAANLVDVPSRTSAAPHRGSPRRTEPVAQPRDSSGTLWSPEPER